MTARNSTLKHGKPLKRTALQRNTRLERKGGSMFKLTADDKAQWEWMAAQRPQPCDVCGYRTHSRCHIIARSHGGSVLDNVIWLCEDHQIGDGLRRRGCHSLQEKRHLAFMAELEAEGNPVNLSAVASAHTAQWRKETGRG
ncbi:hypothetical protein LCGC14_0757810 [marine sediment metagenome]|uniref:HNH nuclease domain-containing protein n=1 Tax=marine sediment metagenome TaxID=412755 RepID=A0A0F9SME0_9ZZZZ